MIEVVRAGQDHLVAGPGDAHQREAEGLVAARGDADLGRRDRGAVERGEVGCIFLAQGRQAEDRRVAVHRRDRAAVRPDAGATPWPADSRAPPG